MDKTREEIKMEANNEMDKNREEMGDKIDKELKHALETSTGERSPDDLNSLKHLYELAHLPMPRVLEKDVTSDELTIDLGPGDPAAKNVFEKTTGRPMPDPNADEPVLSWVDEIKIRAQELLPAYDPQVIVDAKNYLSDIEAKKILNTYEASFNYNAGVMIAELMPGFSTPNVNGFYLHPSLKKRLLEKLNSKKIFLKDAHSRSIKDIIGVIIRGREKDGRIIIEADITDPKISEILEKYPDKLGVSIGGSGTGYCTECGKQVMGMTRCSTHPKASIEVRKFDLKEISLCEDPAWNSSKVKSYK